ncbi:MAG: CoA-binding protein [Candidatus Micrarchaeia archaeon]
MDWSKIRTIAFVGVSANRERDSYKVMRYFFEKGFEVIPINPNYDSIDEIKCYPSLSALPEDIACKIDMVDVFRKSEFVTPIAKEAIEVKKKYNNLKIFWMQVGVSNDDAARMLQDAGIEVYQNVCAMVTHKLDLH